MYRKTWLEINLDKIENNFKACAEICSKKMIAVIKADGYGCGDSFVAKAVIEAGAQMLAVSSLDEALMLRNEKYDGPILILGATDPIDCNTMIESNISAAAFSLDWVNKIIKQNPQGLKVHLKVDTGMNRIGFKNLVELKEAFEKLKNAGCVMEGIFTHFCCVDSNMQMTLTQYHTFEKAVKFLDYPFEWVHCDNSDATVSFKDDISNACRLGISLYGISSYKKDLEYPVSLYTTVSMVKTVPSLETIGYGATYQTNQDEIIATLPIGYADGFIRANSGRNVYVDGDYCKIVGRICMDQTMVKLEKKVDVNTIVEIFGEHINIEQMASDLNTIPYEILTLMSDRITRKYIWHNEKFEETNFKLIKSNNYSIK